MNIKDQAAKLRQLQQDETFIELLKCIENKQTDVFLSISSTMEEREQAHDIIRALNAIDDHFNAVYAAEAIYDRKSKK